MCLKLFKKLIKKVPGVRIWFHLFDSLYSIKVKWLIFFAASKDGSKADIISYVCVHKSLLIDQGDDNLGYECSCVILILFTVFKEHLVPCTLEVILGFKRRRYGGMGM